MPATETSHWPRTVAYGTVFAIVGLETAALGPTLPGLAAQIGVDLDQASLFFTSHALGYLLGSLAGGWFYDRVAGHPVMATMLYSLALVLGLVPLVPSLPLLAVVWLAAGLAGGALDVGGNTLLVWLHGRRVGPYMNAIHFFFGVGSFLSPLLVALALSLWDGVGGAYWALALVIVPAATWLARLPSPRRQHGDRPVNEGQAGPQPDARDQRRQIVALIALLLLLYVGAEAAFGGWIYSYALATGLGGETSAAYLNSAFWGALTAGRLLSIPVAARYRPSRLLLADLCGCLLSVGLVLLWPRSTPSLWLGTMGLGLSMATIFPTAITVAERRVGITGQITGWFLAASSVGAMTLPWLIGQLFESIGPQVTMAAILADLTLALGVFGALMLTSQREGYLENPPSP
jgi:FHS family Na+ dependent glucose MFS transporter 1